MKFSSKQIQICLLPPIRAKNMGVFFSRYHQTHKTQTLADLKKGKLDVVITTFETCRDNIVSLWLENLTVSKIYCQFSYCGLGMLYSDIELGQCWLR